MKYDHVVVQNPSLPATQLFLLCHAAGDNPVATSEIGRCSSGAFPHAIDDRAMQFALERLQFTVPRRYFDEAFSGSKPGDEDVVALM